MALDRKALLAAKPDLPSESVDAPELGGALIVRGLNGKDQTAFLKAVNREGGRPGEIDVDQDTFNAKLLVCCLVDDEGRRLLKDGEHDVVLSWPGAVYNRLALAAMRVNGMGGLEGNSDATAGGGSFSGSPSH